MAQGRRGLVVLGGMSLFFALIAVTCIVIALVVVEQPGARFFGHPGSPYRQWFIYGCWGGSLLAAIFFVHAIYSVFFTFFTTISIAGVHIGAFALVTVLSVMGGFENDLRSKILGSNAHIRITRGDEQPFEHFREVAQRIEKVPGVVAHTPYVSSEVVIARTDNQAFFNVVIKGIEPETVSKVTNIRRDIHDETALQKLWPLAADGAIIGPPSDAGVGVKEQQDAGVHIVPPIDLSGDGGVVDPAPADIYVDDSEPLDLSGGVDEPVDLSGGVDEPLDLSGGDGRSDGGAVIEGTEAPLGGTLVLDGDGGIVSIPFDDLPSHPPPLPPRIEFDIPIRPDIAELPGMLVGDELVKQIQLEIDGEVRIVSPLFDEAGVSPHPRQRKFRVAGTFYTGMYEYDLKQVYVELEALQSFLKIEGMATGIEVRVANPNDTDAIRRGIQVALGPEFRVQDWRELNRGLFSALKLEKIAMFLVLMIIIIVAALSIIGNLIMVVVEKAKEIALLKTLGATDRGVIGLFVAQGLGIGIVGTLGGVTHGVLTAVAIQTIGIPIPADVYYIAQLPVHLEMGSVFAVAAAGLAISVVATIYPAFLASRLKPVEGLRYE